LIGIEDSGGTGAGHWRGWKRCVFARASRDMGEKERATSVIENIQCGAGTRIDIQ
jgi:hypothetical protein